MDQCVVQCLWIIAETVHLLLHVNRYVCVSIDTYHNYTVYVAQKSDG